jgi:hypothetical protein
MSYEQLIEFVKPLSGLNSDRALIRDAVRSDTLSNKGVLDSAAAAAVPVTVADNGQVFETPLQRFRRHPLFDSNIFSIISQYCRPGMYACRGVCKHCSVTL